MKVFELLMQFKPDVAIVHSLDFLQRFHVSVVFSMPNELSCIWLDFRLTSTPIKLNLL